MEKLAEMHIYYQEKVVKCRQGIAKILHESIKSLLIGLFAGVAEDLDQ